MKPRCPSGFAAYCDIEKEYPILHRAVAQGVNGGTLTPPDGWTWKDAEALLRQADAYYTRAMQVALAATSQTRKTDLFDASKSVLAACAEMCGIAEYWLKAGLAK